MLPLAFNMVLPQTMRAKYQVAMGVLPITLMFSSFIPLFLVVPWLETVMGIPHNSPVRDHPNGMLWLALFMAAFVVGMIVGYLLGWVVNAAIARYFLGWPASKVSAVFLNSEVPDHWLKIDQPATERGNAARESSIKWENQRKLGAFRFIVSRGMGAWGGPMFIAMYLVPTWSRGGTFTLATALFQIALWASAGGAFGAVIWYTSESNYKKLKAKDEP